MIDKDMYLNNPRLKMAEIVIPKPKDQAKRELLLSLSIGEALTVDQSQRQRYADIACELKRHGKGVFRTSKNGPEGKAIIWREA